MALSVCDVSHRARDSVESRREIADAAIREGLTPLEYMLAVLRDEDADPDRRDRMAAAAPYIHPRLSSTQMDAAIIKRDITELTRDELLAIIHAANAEAGIT